jgi:hypothetical protein
MKKDMEALAVKERPILFSTPMVKDILEGRKMVTRRVVKPDEWVNDYDKLGCGIYNPALTDKNGDLFPGPDTFGIIADDGELCLKSPYGKPGDILWVRETFEILDYWEDSKSVHVLYEGGATAVCHLNDSEWKKFMNWQERCERKPSLFMFKSICRLKLEIVSIGVERLQDIAEEDAKREGIYECTDPLGGWTYKDSFGWPTAKEAFQALWISINGAESWEANPWVWVISFRKI